MVVVPYCVAVAACCVALALWRLRWRRRTLHVYSLEGNIGAGKTTLLNALKSLGYQTGEEPLNAFRDIGSVNMLELQYKDPPKYKALFQCVAAVALGIHRMKLLLQCAGCRVVIVERNISSVDVFTNVAYRDGLLCEDVRLILHWMVDSVAGILDAQQEASGLRVVTHRVYLRTQVEKAYGRMQKRARTEESEVNMGLIQALHDEHETMFLNREDVIVIDGNQPLENVVKEFIEKTNIDRR